MSKFIQAKSFISYYLNAVNKHSLHSPFIYEFYNKVLFPLRHENKGLKEIEALRNALLKEGQVVAIQELGAGSKSSKSNLRSISQIARTSLSGIKFSCLYNRIIQYYQSKEIVELGTSLGINTLYLANSPHSKVTTFEGCPNLSAIALQNFEKANKQNIELVVGNIDETLHGFLKNLKKLDFVFFDANHRLAPTLSYFEACLEKADNNSIFIFDDIHWSAEMERAWQTICAHKKVSVSIDLYRCGIIFFNQNTQKQHYILEF